MPILNRSSSFQFSAKNRTDGIDWEIKEVMIY